MSATSCRLTCRNDLAELPALSAKVQDFAKGKQVSTRATYALELAIEELVTNIIKYGYEDSNEHTIDIRIEMSSNNLLLTIEDDGHAFNPIESRRPDTTSAPEDREIGGLGLHMVREMSERMEYRRDRDHNVTVIQIRCT